MTTEATRGNPEGRILDLELAELAAQEWFDYLIAAGQAQWIEEKGLAGGGQTLQFNRKVAEGFAIGPDKNGDVILAVLPAVGNWFVDLDWKFALHTPGHLQLNGVWGDRARRREQRLSVSIPMSETVAAHLPLSGTVFLMGLIPDNEPEDVAMSYNLVGEAELELRTA